VPPGARVVLAPGFGCRACGACRAGWDNQCSDYRIRGAAAPGGYAELTLADARDVLLLPAAVSFETAAAYPLVFLTAWHMLVTRVNLKAGETVLIHAAGSGVGHAALRIAKHLGAIVYATVGSTAKVAKAQALGADAVINSQEEDVEARVKTLTQQRGVAVVFEHVGPATFEHSVRVLAKGGRLVTCGATSGPSVSLDLRYLFSRQLSLLGCMMGRRPELEQLSPLIFKGQLQPVIDTVFPLREAKLAHERIERRDVFGKFVLVP
jgi:NADPH:quinone reductase-like Zn-dependent oxidoreductase